MHRQIWIREDRQFHKILWQDENSNSIGEYELQTVTFGTAPAAYHQIVTTIGTKCNYPAANHRQNERLDERSYLIRHGYLIHWCG